VDASVRPSRRRLLAVLGGLVAVSAASLAAFLLVGAPARGPNDLSQRLPLSGVRFQDGQGKELSLEDFRGRVVLLNLWATWCAPCRKEMPALDRLQMQLGGPGFEVVAVSIDRDPELVREFFREHGIESLALYIDASGDITGTLRAIGIPTTLLVDREGREIWRMTGPAEWDAPPSVAAIHKHVEPATKQ
jgi:thiol-disulfide isomerase/thioredoxin